jgi:hypothetical protein
MVFIISFYNFKTGQDGYRIVTDCEIGRKVFDYCDEAQDAARLAFPDAVIAVL